MQCHNTRVPVLIARLCSVLSIPNQLVDLVVGEVELEEMEQWGPPLCPHPQACQAVMVKEEVF